MPRVAIVIPTYNSEQHITQALQSATSQTFSDIEIVVSDNASTDRTVCIVQSHTEKDKRIRLVTSPCNDGPVNNWTRGLQQARSPYSCLLFSDDVLAPSLIEQLLPVVSDHQVGIALPCARVLDSNTGTSSVLEFFKDTGKEYLLDSPQILKGNLSLVDYSVPISPCGSLCRTEDLIDALSRTLPCFGPLQCQQHGAGPDLMVFLHCAQKRPLFGYFPKPLVTFRKHAANLSGLTITRLAYFATRAEFWDCYLPTGVSARISVGEHMAFRAWWLARLRKEISNFGWKPSIKWSELAVTPLLKQARRSATSACRRKFYGFTRAFTW